MDVMAGYAANPNVYGVIVVSLGCENCQNDLVVDAIKERTNKPIKTLVIQEEHGTLKTIEKLFVMLEKWHKKLLCLEKKNFQYLNLY